MNVTCPECRSVFRVDPTKLPSASVRARCAVCGGLITVTPATSVREEFAAAPRPSIEAAAADLSAGGAGRTFTRADAQRPGSGPPSTHALPVTPRPGSPFGPPAGGPVAPPPAVAAAAVPSGGGAAPVAPTQAAPRQPARSEPPAVRPPLPDAAPPNLGAATAAALFGRVDAPAPGPSAGGAGGRGAAPPPRAPSPARPAMPFVRPGTGPAGAGPTPHAPTSGPPPFAGRATPPGTQNAPRRPINPFLANDPNAKARRLARALISDMVTYFPEKREEGLRSGTLKQLFEEEIKKSYEEYMGQVGREFAESTPHFQDALNEILAGGRKLF